MTPIFHITTAEDVERARESGDYTPPGFARDGFIHCSYLTQVVPVANRLFAGRPGLVLLQIDRETLACPVIDENLEGGEERFPHIYGSLPLAAVVAIHPFRCEADGTFVMPIVRAGRLSGS